VIRQEGTATKVSASWTVMPNEDAGGGQLEGAGEADLKDVLRVAPSAMWRPSKETKQTLNPI
jgi:hypothetical protein